MRAHAHLPTPFSLLQAPSLLLDCNLSFCISSEFSFNFKGKMPLPIFPRPYAIVRILTPLLRGSVWHPCRGPTHYIAVGARKCLRENLGHFSPDPFWLSHRAKTAFLMPIFGKGLGMDAKASILVWGREFSRHFSAVKFSPPPIVCGFSL